MRRSLAFVVAVVLIVSCRRETAAPSVETTTAAVARQSVAGRKVIFIGLDGADWLLLDDLIRRGAMPQLARLVAEGEAGTLKTINPALSPLIWTTMMTGTSPLEHRILDFVRFHPESRTLEPITSDERAVPAVWNIASWGGKTVGVFGLWATFPAEQINGVVVSDRALPALGRSGVYPDSFAPDVARAIEEARRSLSYERLRQFLPTLDRATWERSAYRSYDDPPSAIRRLVVETEAVHRMARNWVSTAHPDLSIVYIQGTDVVGHLFAPYAPPKRPEISADDFARYSGVTAAYYEYVDTLLGEWRSVAERENAVLLLASDHGFQWGEGRPLRASSALAPTAAKWHRQEGMSLLWSPDSSAAPSTPVRTAASVDRICATLLELLGLPPGEGIAGPPLEGTARIAGRAPLTSRVNYRRLFRRQRSAAPPDSAPDEGVERLQALGYLGAKESGLAPPGSTSTRTPSSFNNEGLLWRAAHDDARARAAFEAAIALDRGYAPALWNLSELLMAGAERNRADDLLVQAVAGGLADGIEQLASRARSDQKSGDDERAIALLSRGIALAPREPNLLLLRGRSHMNRKACVEARSDFARAVELTPRNPIAHASLALALFCLGESAAARRALERSLSLDPDQPELRRFLGE